MSLSRLIDISSVLIPKVTGLRNEAQVIVTEEYKNEQAYSDGEIVRKIRLYHRKRDDVGEQRWWARLSNTKRKDLRQLLRDAQYALAFDTMLPWPGLWSPIRLGSLHRLLTMKCDEVCRTPSHSVKLD